MTHEITDQEIPRKDRVEGRQEVAMHDHAGTAGQDAKSKGKKKRVIVKPAIAGARNHKWKGGQIVSHGRIMIHSPNHPNPSTRSYVYRYRLVMEAHLGRFLSTDEIVHHRNGNSMDDRLENLELTNQSRHTIEHKTLALLGKWSCQHAKCFECGTTSRRHKAYGLCIQCHERHRSVKRRQQKRNS